jgi:ribosomal protein L20
MTRIKGSALHLKRRRGILKHTKGYKWGRKSKIKVAKAAKMKAGLH